MARPHKLTDEVQAVICKALEDGASWSAAAAAAGLHRATVQRWRERGEAAKQGRFCDFCDNATRALARGEARAARQLVAGFMEPSTETVIDEAPDGSRKTRTVTRPPDAALALKWLERRFPDRWSPNQNMTIRHASVREALAAIDAHRLPASELATLERILDILEPNL